MSAKPLGSAATPAQKKKVAVFGGGGSLGATTFGFLQRASSLYGTGLGGASTPRCVCATAVSSQQLNRVLGKAFVLAFAGEDMVRLTDMTDVDAIAQRLQGYHAIVMGTAYQLEVRPITPNTYETTPNDKTVEFNLDEFKGGGGLDNYDEYDEETQLTMFQNTLEACQKAGIQHIVVVETPQTKNSKPYAEALDKAGVPFTYILACGEWVNTHDYTHKKGVQTDLNIESYTFKDGYQNEQGFNAGDWIESIARNKGTGSISREDIAAMAVQSLQSLDWSTSRCLEVFNAGPLPEAFVVAGSRPDREWCANSQVLAEKLGAVK